MIRIAAECGSVRRLTLARIPLAASIAEIAFMPICHALRAFKPQAHGVLLPPRPCKLHLASSCRRERLFRFATE